MPAWYSAIMTESEEIKWRAKSNTELSALGPDDRRVVIEFEGDLEKVPWIDDIHCEDITVDLGMLADAASQLFDKPWIKGRHARKITLAAMGHHYLIDIQL